MCPIRTGHKTVTKNRLLLPQNCSKASVRTWVEGLQQCTGKVGTKVCHLLFTPLLSLFTLPSQASSFSLVLSQRHLKLISMPTNTCLPITFVLQYLFSTLQRPHHQPVSWTAHCPAGTQALPSLVSCGFPPRQKPSSPSPPHRLSVSQLPQALMPPSLSRMFFYHLLNSSKDTSNIIFSSKLPFTLEFSSAYFTPMSQTVL